MDTQMFSSKTTSSDPFATVSYRGVEHKTEVQKKEVNPVWDFECEWPDLELDAKYDTRLWPDGRPMDGPDGKPPPNMLTKMFSRQQADFQKKRDEARRDKAARRTPRFSEEDWEDAVIVQVWDWDRTSGNDIIGEVRVPMRQIRRMNFDDRLRRSRAGPSAARTTARGRRGSG